MTAFNQTENTKEMKDFEIEIRKVDEIHMVYYEHIGPYMESFNDFGKFMAYMQQNNMPMGSHALGVFYDDPKEVPEPELRSEAGHMVTVPVKTSNGYKYKKIKGGKAVSIRYKAMDEIIPAYDTIAKYIENKGYETRDYSIEIYYSNDPNVVDAEILMYIK